MEDVGEQLLFDADTVRASRNSRMREPSIAFDRSSLKIHNCRATTKTAVTVTPSNKKKYIAQVRHPSPFVSSRMPGYKTRNKRCTFKRRLGLIGRERYAIFGDTRTRHIITTVTGQKSPVSDLLLRSLGQPTGSTTFEGRAIPRRREELVSYGRNGNRKSK